MAPLLEISGLVKRFGERTVLDGIDLVVERGETIVVLGGSGSGKSTLARVLVGLERATAGHILLEGRDLVGLGEHELAVERRRFGMVFQKYALLDSLTVFENVAFPLTEDQHLPAEEVRPRVMEQLEALGVAGAAELLPGELSGGMAKRVGIARAMVMRPEILVYDEPTSGLDPVTSRVVDGLIEDVRERFCVTSIVITHDMATAYGIADRVVLLHGGRIVLDGPPDHVLALDDPRIASFACSSGVEPARLQRRARRRSPADIRKLWDARPSREGARFAPAFAT
ncbi:MAG: ABC transporter ATP-binding protein [Labilithrix sp.]|nr:ABC transporter ATP-binding protein [Labilithrix sp.]